MKAQERELLLQALETELGGVQVYKTAIDCVVNEDLREEWEEYLEQTEQHVQIVKELLARLSVDESEETDGREIVKKHGQALVEIMTMALEAGDKTAAQLVAAEAVVSAELKDHANWELLGELAKNLSGDEAKAIRDAVDRVEEEEDEHYYHSKGWMRELWIESLGMKAALPPPEERKHVKTAIAAARAKQSRTEMVRKIGGKKKSEGTGRRAR
jgi:rubrerythrin